MKKRSTFEYNRNFTILLYPEDELHMKAFENIQKKFDYAYILHDKDKDEKGEIKKEHYHIVIRTGNNPRWRTAVAEELGIKENYIEGCNLEKQLRYLIHFDNPDKYQYDIENVKGNLKKRMLQSIQKDGKTDTERAGEILNFIKEQNKLNIFDLTEWAIENGYYDTLKRSQHLFIKIIENKNRRIL